MSERRTLVAIVISYMAGLMVGAFNYSFWFSVAAGGILWLTHEWLHKND
jgi:hypothetical protein